MVAKLSAAVAATARRVGLVRIIDGRGPADLGDRPGDDDSISNGKRMTMTTQTVTLGRTCRRSKSAHVLQVYRRSPVVFVRGSGSRLFDSDGRAWLDLVSGIGVASLGHAHPALARGLADQAASLAHTSNLYFHPLQGEVARRLAALSGLPRAFFCNSGTEAVEACLKFARRYWHAQGAPRPGVVAFEHAFHGRTVGALSVTWDAHYREPFAPLVPQVTWVSPADPAGAGRRRDAETGRNHRRADSG